MYYTYHWLTEDSKYLQISSAAQHSPPLVEATLLATGEGREVPE